MRAIAWLFRDVLLSAFIAHPYTSVSFTIGRLSSSSPSMKMRNLLRQQQVLCRWCGRQDTAKVVESSKIFEQVSRWAVSTDSGVADLTRQV